MLGLNYVFIRVGCLLYPYSLCFFLLLSVGKLGKLLFKINPSLTGYQTVLLW